MPAWIKRLQTLPGGRRAKWLVLAAWLIVAAALGPLAGKLGDVEDTGANAFLPAGAESAQVNTELQQLRADRLMPAVVIYTAGDGGRIGDAARQQTAADRADLAPLAAKGEHVGPPVTADDGRALMTVLPLSGDDDLTRAVEQIRDTAAANAPPGLEVAVGGPAAALIDEVAVFDALDTTLLLATAAVVAVLLLLTYRSPVLWLLPLVSVGFAAVLTQATTYLLARYAGLPVDPQSAGVLMVLVFGVGTDYALLLIARFREELHRHADRHQALRVALRRSGPAVAASAGTVAAGLACLALADINSSRSLGLVGAVGVLCAFLAMSTVLPALLVVTGRWVFWPFVPHEGTPPRRPGTVWARIGAGVARRPRSSWLVSAAATGALALGVVGTDMGLTHAEMFQDKPQSVVAQERISAHYPSGASAPATVVTDAGQSADVAAAARATPGVASVRVGDRSPDGALAVVSATLADAPGGPAAENAVDALRERVHAVDGAEALVGGPTAENLDTRRAAAGDLRTVLPVVLLVVLLVLVWLLRALVAPVLLLATVVLSYLGALGASNLLFTHVLGYAGVDWSIPLMGFVFLVALGIDYNIFLMTRIREEARHLGHVHGVLEGLTSTGGVITSAGLVLAATFGVFAGLPLVTMAQMGVLVGVGVLLDTFLVRTVLVPALALDLGRRSWWPGGPGE